MHPNDRVGVIDQWQKSVVDEREFIQEFRFLRPNREVRWVLARARPIRTSNARVLGLKQAYRVSG
ncbi:MAG: PAS domain-containing protein [Verrucomicrobia bacterium]|nr:PAS domain-containing protein [Verrucomicrobiota bacterium]